MTHDIDLRKIERKAWTSFQHDGLWEIALGLVMLIMGFRSVMKEHGEWLMPAAVLVLPLTIYLIKRLVVIPRLGYVRFGRERRTRNIWAVGVLVVSVAIASLGFLAASGFSPPLWEWLGRHWMPLLFLVKALVVFWLLAWFLDYKPLYYSGAVFALGLGLGDLLGGALVFFTAGALILLPGIVFFARFLAKYPSHAEEAVR